MLRNNCYRLLLVLLIFFACLVLNACTKKIHYLDNEDVEVIYVQEEKEGDQLVVHIGFQADDASDIYNPVYKVEWFKDDVFIESTSWRPLMVRGGVIVRATERSTVPGADTFQIIISNDPR